MDNLGNINAEEGCTRCQCGCKYWENDICIDCGTTVEIVEIRHAANRARFMNEVKLNVMLTTWEAGMGINAHTLDLVDTTEKYRAMGAIS